MDGKPASRSTPRFDMPLAWWLAVSVLLATVSSLGVSNGRVLAASAAETPATTTPPSIEPIQTPVLTSTPAPSEEPKQTPGPTLTPAPTQEPIHAYVEAEVLVRPPGAVEGWTWLSGWVFAAAFEGANVIWAEPVTKEDQVPATWLIELTGESARAALTIAPDEGFSVVRVRCLGGELGDQPIPAAFEGSTVSFEITRQHYATYTCAFITEQIGEPPTPGSLSVTFDPPQGRPGSKISVPETICGIYEPTVDQIWFSDRFVPQNPDGSTAFFSPEGTADIIPEPGEATDFGIVDNGMTFVVPRVPAGEYYLYVSCSDASACCVPLQPTFQVLALPDTATVSPTRSGTAIPMLVLGLSFGIGAAFMTFRLRRPKTPRRPDLAPMSQH